jgi:hypothetical protein
MYMLHVEAWSAAKTLRMRDSPCARQPASAHAPSRSRWPPCWTPRRPRRSTLDSGPDSEGLAAPAAESSVWGEVGAMPRANPTNTCGQQSDWGAGAMGRWAAKHVCGQRPPRVKPSELTAGFWAGPGRWRCAHAVPMRGETRTRVRTGAPAPDGPSSAFEPPATCGRRRAQHWGSGADEKLIS